MIAGKRILMLLENSSYKNDGRVQHEAGALRDAGYDVSVICPKLNAGDGFHERIDGIHLYQYPPPGGGGGLWGYIWEYGYATTVSFLLSVVVFVSRGFDIVHAHNPPDTLFLVALPYRLLGRRFVYDHHDLSPELYDVRSGGRGNRLVRGVLVLLERLSCRIADTVIVTNESYRDLAIRRGGVPRARTVVVRNAPSVDRLRAAEARPEPVSPGKSVLLYVGIMGIQDGVDYLLRALHHLKYSLGREDFTCLLVGSGDAIGGVRALGEQLDLNDNLVFTGFLPREEVPRYLSMADICVAPEPSNPLNDRSTMIKIMEYMAAGKPVVAFDLPEHRFTADGAAAYACANNELDFARQIAVLMDDPTRRGDMSRAGRARIQGELAWQHQAARLIEAYDAMTRPQKREATGQILRRTER